MQNSRTKKDYSNLPNKHGFPHWLIHTKKVALAELDTRCVLELFDNNQKFNSYKFSENKHCKCGLGKLKE